MRRKYDHKAKPDPMSRKNDMEQSALCIDCYRPIHARWMMVGPHHAEADMRWVHTSFR